MKMTIRLNKEDGPVPCIRCKTLLDPWYLTCGFCDFCAGEMHGWVIPENRSEKIGESINDSVRGRFAKRARV